MAIDHVLLDDIAERITNGLKLLGTMQQEAKEQVRATLENALVQMDMVTDERMQVSEALLAKAMEEMTRLEARIQRLEEEKQVVKK